jgi:hypothetical protein
LQSNAAEANRRHAAWADAKAAEFNAMSPSDQERILREHRESMAKIESQMADIRSRPDHLSGLPATPSSPAAAREAELLERAMTASPDYSQALRRAAVANIDEAPPAPRERPQARYQRIEAEEARLSDLIERRRRERLAQRGQQDRAAQAAAARAACDAQASAVGAGMYTPYSPRGGILGSALAGAINSSAAEEQARIGCYRAYGF